MDQETETTREDIRAMVLDMALERARDVMESVRNGGLSEGHKESHGIEVEGGTWCLKVTYWSDPDMVHLTGHLHPDMEASHPIFQAIMAAQQAASMGQEIPEGVMIFGQTQQGRDGFDYTLPAAWLPEGTNPLST